MADHPLTDMMVVPIPAAWLYTRGTESVRIDVMRDGDLFVLSVSGPGKRRMLQQCADALAVLDAQLAHEAFLIAQGFTLHDFATRRRPKTWAGQVEEVATQPTGYRQKLG
jgi:hypothetical protein